ncbi:MAG: aspartate/glutamate racemase family protein [Sphingomicrobium sp.]
MLEQEWPRFLPDDMLFPVARIRMCAATADGYAALAGAAPEAARDLATAGCDVIVYACAIGSLFAGPAAEAELVTALGAASGKPAIGLAEASVRALRQLGARQVAILTPYAPPTNRWVTDYLAATGFGSAGIISTPVDIITVGDLQPAEIADLAAAGLADYPGADALWIPCTAIQTLEAIAAIEERSGLPVVSGSQALLWASLRAIGVADPLPGAGRLLA